jgi:hypothetical protein
MRGVARGRDNVRCAPIIWSVLEGVGGSIYRRQANQLVCFVCRVRTYVRTYGSKQDTVFAMALLFQ